MSDPAITRLFGAMVAQVGGVDAAAALIEARWGTGSKGTVSKMRSGQACVTVEAMVALEDALQVHTLTKHLTRRIDAARRDISPDDIKAILYSLVAKTSETSGCVSGKVLRAFSAMSDDPEHLTRAERAEILSLMAQLRDTADQVIQAVDGI